MPAALATPTAMSVNGNMEFVADNVPLVSAIICTFNRPEMLRRALHSVLNQQFQDYEVIIVDDRSDEPVPSEIASSDRIRLIRTKHLGVGAARATGLNAARGEFVAYCDDDDEWRPEHLNTLYGYLCEQGDVDLVYGDSEWLLEDQNSGVCYSFDFDVHHLNYSGNFIFATDVMHRREPAMMAGGFDASLTANEDWDLWLRMSQQHVFRHFRKTLATHHRHSGFVSNGGNWDNWQRVHQKKKERVARQGVASGHGLHPPSGERRLSRLIGAHGRSITATRLSLGGRGIYWNCPDASYHGVTEAEANRSARAPTGSGWLRSQYAAIPKELFIDSDPMFTQIGLLLAKPDVPDRVRAHDFHFTFAENIGAGDCRVPAAGFNWLPTRQPIVLDWWSPVAPLTRDAFTTVMNWVSYTGAEFAGEQWGQKEAVAGIEEIEADYAHHSAEAPALAEREFDAGHVLSSMLEDTGP